MLYVAQHTVCCCTACGLARSATAPPSDEEPQLFSSCRCDVAHDQWRNWHAGAAVRCTGEYRMCSRRLPTPEGAPDSARACRWPHLGWPPQRRCAAARASTASSLTWCGTGKLTLWTTPPGSRTGHHSTSSPTTRRAAPLPQHRLSSARSIACRVYGNMSKPCPLNFSISTTTTRMCK